MGVNSLPKTVTRQRRGCDLNPGPYALESSTLTARLLSHPHSGLNAVCQHAGSSYSSAREDTAAQCAEVGRISSSSQLPAGSVQCRNDEVAAASSDGGPLVVAPPPDSSRVLRD